MYAFGVEMKAVTGYATQADVELAVMRGDGDGRLSTISRSRTMIRDGDKKPLFIFADTRDLEYPDLPTIFEVAEQLRFTEDKVANLEVIVSIYSLHRSFFGPPGMDAAVVAELRDGIYRALSDEEFQRISTDARMPFDPIHGDTIQERVAFVMREGQKLVPMLQAATAAIQ
jgi:tripartite-type tricarboxylate transporter receptor subunit TctC